MSLVAYESSSDEGSSSEAEEQSTDSGRLGDASSLEKITKNKGLSLPPPKSNAPFAGSSDPDEESPNKKGYISDDEEYFPDLIATPNGVNNSPTVKPEANPIHFEKLPTPKTSTTVAVVEEDDEFLHKKASSTQIEKPPATRAPVKITIPSLADFKDLDDEKKEKLRLPQGPSLKSCGLLNLLPRPKNVQPFTKTNSDARSQSAKPTKASLIPDSVKNRQTKLKDKAFRNPLKAQPQSLVANKSDSEGSDNEADFFSLNTKQELPEVSQNEINSMVAKRAAKMAETSSKIDEMLTPLGEEDDVGEEESEEVQQEIRFDEKAMHALVGSSAKRRKVEVNVVELSSEQVLPNKDEWLRSALAQATTYQPKGVLVDEEPVPGTRKKHQITYLAHQAKANELELQAMWSANRHTRRQTQSKYGF